MRTDAPHGMLRFALAAGAWFVGLFGLMRIEWVERTLLTPFAQLQQRVADQLTGAPPGLVYADASCSGGDPMALCLGTIMAFPAARAARLRGAVLGLAVITGLNVVRLGTLSLAASNRTLLELLHVYVWPGILILAAVAYVYGWMLRQGRDGAGAVSADRRAGAAPGAAARRFLLLAALLVAAWFAAAPSFYESAAADRIAGWIALFGGAILTAAGTAAAVSGAVIRTAHGGFVVTQECIFTPLIPLYVAGALAAPLTMPRRVLALAATPAVFFALGVARLLVLAAPAAVVGSHAVAIHAFSQMLVAVLLVAAVAAWAADGARRAAGRAAAAIGVGALAGIAAAPVVGATVASATAGLQALAGHAGHAFADSQGAAAILPVFQIGLFAALWAAARRTAPRRAALGLAGLALVQAAVGVAAGELASHAGFDPHVGLIRAWAIALPAAMVWALGPRIKSPARAPAPAGALPQPG